MSDTERTLRDGLSSASSAFLALRMSAWVLVLPLAKRIVSIERLAKVMWRGRASERDRGREELAVRLASRLTRFSGRNCLERSLILYRYLSDGGADPVLVLGIDDARQRNGHAWVTLDGVPVIESAAALEKYEPIVAFGRSARRLSPAKSETLP
jgi:hypothetical protein